MTEQVNENLQAMDLKEKPQEAAVDGAQETKEDFVDPWNVASGSEKGIDYEKLISKFMIEQFTLTIIQTKFETMSWQKVNYSYNLIIGPLITNMTWYP